MRNQGGPLRYSGIRRLSPGPPSYPTALQARGSNRVPGFVAATGDLGVLDRERVAIFCSVRCPGDVIIKSYDLAKRLRESDLTIVGGFQSPMEKEVLSILLRGTASLVVCPARGLKGMRISADWRKPLADGRFLVLSCFDDSVRRATTDLAAKRNAYVAALAERILIAHAERGGKTEGLCRDALARGKPVFTLDSPDNVHLVDLGAVPVRAEDPRPLVAA